MTTTRQRPARSKVRHGMPSCADYGCRRDECIAARRLANKRSAYAATRGITGYVDASRATRHVQKLQRAGMSITDIAARSGVSDSPVRALAAGRRTRITRTTHEAILGLPVPERGTIPAHLGFVDATGAMRRLQALGRIGFGLPYLSGRLGVSKQGLGKIRRGARDRIRIAVHRDIAAIYDELWNQNPLAHGLPEGPTATLRLHAVRSGWPLPAELDDDRIDWADEAAA